MVTLPNDNETQDSEPIDNTIKGENDELDEDEVINLKYGEPLEVDECSAVLRMFRSRVIAIVGPTGAGKTSLIASIYELCQTQGLSKFNFSRTRTFYAFERAIHDSRVACLREEGKMLHTPFYINHGGVVFYHLGLFDKTEDKLIDLLFADRTGEDYNAAKDDPHDKHFLEIERADSITLLVDGERLLDSSKRYEHESDTTLVIQAFIEGKMIPHHQRLLVALTKLDKINAAEDGPRNRVKADFAKLVEKLGTLYGSWFSSILSFEIACLPANGSSLSIGHGAELLLQEWVKERKVPHEKAPTPDSSKARSFSRFTFGKSRDD